MAMAGVCMTAQDSVGPIDMASAARASYQLADAMVAERNRFAITDCGPGSHAIAALDRKVAKEIAGLEQLVAKA